MKFSRFKTQEPTPRAAPEISGVGVLVYISSFGVVLSPLILLVALLCVGGLTNFIAAVAEQVETMRWTFDRLVDYLLIFALYILCWWWILFVNKQLRKKPGH